ncbi:MAG: hypothetical protein RMJ67_07725 [Elusimicrobiota bacterium]|nr:hypothetical protein [Endomicrobiia bacterium]MDW8166381.1 hypothetical protein [Elusimicrobiota bacterium]
MKKQLKTKETKQIKKEFNPSELVDKYGQLVEMEKQLKEEKDALKKQILDLLTSLNVEKLSGSIYTITKVSTILTELDPLKVYEIAGKKHFNELFRVNMENVKKHLSIEQIEKCTITHKEGSPKLIVKKNE